MNLALNFFALLFTATAVAQTHDPRPADSAGYPLSAAGAASDAAPATHPTGRAVELVAQLADSFRARKDYAVQFEIAAGDNDVAGRYAVAGDSYYLTLGDAEVYCDGKVRYEVDNRRREVTVDRVDASSRNLLDNPVRAFDFLGGDFASELLGERDGHAAIRLTPVAGGSPAGDIIVTLALDPMRPVRLAYDYDGERITVSIVAVEPLAGPLKHFDRAAYEGYEFIDFR